MPESSHPDTRHEQSLMPVVNPPNLLIWEPLLPLFGDSIMYAIIDSNGWAFGL
jgi:hypothetical protein